MSRDFDGSTGYLSHANPDAVQPASSHSLCAWVWLDVANESVAIISNDLTTPIPLCLALVSNGSFGSNPGLLWVAHWTGSTWQGVADTGDLAITQWVHVCGVRDASLYRLYVNGVQKATAAKGTPPANVNGLDLYIGQDWGEAGRFNGKIAEVAFWSSRALGAEEVAALAKGTSPLSFKPTAHIPIWGVASPEPDIAGALGSFVVNGTAPQAAHAPVGPPLMVAA